MTADGTRWRLPAPLSRFFGRAEETGAALRTRFRDGACFVDLTSVQDGAVVPAAVASALGIAQRPGRAVADTVVEALASAELLVVLDNCEHVVHATAAMTRSLLSGCEGLRVLATSRVPLGITGEQLFPLPPLECSAR